MAENEKNKKTLIYIVVGLLLVVLVMTGYGISYSNKNNESNIEVKINQIYSSDYKLSSLDNKYFIGSYEPNKIDVIIDSEGNEIFKGEIVIYYDGIYKLKDERYLIYDNNNGNLITYIFDGTTINKYYEIKDVNYVKPIVYTTVDKEYVVAFASMVDNDLYLYGLNSSGIIVLDDTTLIADNDTNEAYYIYSEEYLVVENEDKLKGVIRLNGDVIIDYKYKDIINNGNDTFIALNNKNKYGIIDKNNEVLVKFNYKVIDKFDNYYVFVNTNNKMALYDSEFNKISNYDMEYNTLIDYSLRNESNSIGLYKVNGKVVVVNNYLEDINGTEYDKHNAYVIDGNNITNEIKQVGFGYDNIVYSFDNKYNISIYNSDISLLYNIKLDNVLKIESISSVSSEIILIKYIDQDNNLKQVYYDMNGNKIDFKLGELFFKKVEYKGYVKKKDDTMTLTLYDLENNELTSVYGSNITLCNDYLIVDNSIYRLEVKEN